MATTARLATGSAHHHPNEAASAMPSNVLRLKYAADDGLGGIGVYQSSEAPILAVFQT